MEKLDGPLRRIFSDYLRVREGGAPVDSSLSDRLSEDTALFVMVQHTGTIGQLAALGLLNAAALSENLATGDIRLDALEAFAGDPAVIHVEYGTEHDPLLETSVPEIKADQVWTLNRATGAFSGAGETGEGVVIGIIDSGIDITHSDFLKTTAPKTTRIKRIWDPGLDPTGGESSPALALLAPGRAATYGVEYTEADINAELQGGAEIRHADCNGHGTHVASIAAGNGGAGGLPLKNVGVAPKADLVVVKIFSLAKDSPPSFSQRFIDAVHYIQNVVKNDLGDRPLVINYSGGAPTGPHDGLTAPEIFLTNQFRGATGKTFVTSAGNSGNRRAHALITIPAAGTVDVPFELFDPRVLKTDVKRCSRKSNTRACFVDVWYPDIASVKVRVKLATEAAFRATEVDRGDPSFSGTFDGGKSFNLSNERQSAVRPAEPAAVPPVASSTIHRSNITLAVGAHGDDHATGEYVLRFSGPAGTKLHAWCSSGSRQGFKIGAAPPAPPAVDILDEDNLVGQPGGARHVLSVGAYDDVGGAIASFSSRGPLVDHSGAGNLAVKPDLSAPGKGVTAADSSTTLDPVFRGIFEDYTDKSGTSMAAPHVTGAVALMLQKKNNLSLADIIKVMTTGGQGARATAPAKAFGAGKLDAKGAVDNVP